MKVRYTGDADEKALAFPGGFVLFPRMKWVDVGKELDAAHIDRHHLDIVVQGLGDEWEIEDKPSRKAKQEDDE